MMMATNDLKGRLTPYPVGFATKSIETNGATIHARVGGCGAAVVLLHGFGVTSASPSPRSTATA